MGIIIVVLSHVRRQVHIPCFRLTPDCIKPFPNRRKTIRTDKWVKRRRNVRHRTPADSDFHRSRRNRGCFRNSDHLVIAQLGLESNLVHVLSIP